MSPILSAVLSTILPLAYLAYLLLIYSLCTDVPIAYANEPLADEEWLMEKKNNNNKSCKTQLTTQRTRHYGSSQTPTYSGNVVRQENKFD